jgi:polyisoprenoid-binding protein YceI
VSRGRFVLVLALMAVGVVPVAAGERVLTFDPAASSVRFTLDATMHTVHGSLRLVRGEVRFDAVPGPASGEIVVDATSGATGNDGRDEKMNREVLESGRFSEIVLVPGRLDGQVAADGTGTLVVEGVLRLHGAEQQVRWPVAVAATGDRVRATGRFQVPYVAWGLHDPSVFVLRVGKEVAVEVEAVGTLRAATPAVAAEAGAGP